VNTQRFDLYKKFKFPVRLDGRTVAGFSKVSALRTTTEIVDYRAGGETTTLRKLPGMTKFEAITLERGVTHDPEFVDWANKVNTIKPRRDCGVSPHNFLKDINIEVYNEAGQVALTYKVYRCWVSEFQAVPDLDADSNAVAVETIKLENEGWERDSDVTGR
jgi:phage tail-like protein